MANPNATNYGKYYWCIKVDESISPDREIYVYADEFRISEGALDAIGKDGYSLLTIAKDFWHAYFAASVLDGHAIAVEYWKGEISDD